MRIKFIASVVAALSLAFIPTMAQAVATTLDVQNGGNAAVDLEAGDTLDVTVAGPIAKTGAATHELYSTWSTQSLALAISDLSDPGADLTWPEGWTLEYTLDGTTWIDWSVTAPTDALDIIAIRSLGDVNTVGENMFKTTSDGALRAASFSGSGGGDGYNVAIGDNTVFNMYHHAEGTATVQCHTFTGDLCSTSELAIDGYSTNHGSAVYSDDESGKVYGFVMRDSDSHFGVLCFDFSVEPAVGCGFTELETVGAVEGDKQDIGSSSQDGDIIWSISGQGGELLCFNMATGTACPDNGWSTGASDYAMDTGRVTAVDGLVFYTLGSTFACYDPAIDGRCAASGNHTLLDTENRHAPLPVEDTAGNFIGACDIFTEYCIDSSGGYFAMDSDLQAFFDAQDDISQLANQNAAQFAYVDNRFYYLTQDVPAESLSENPSQESETWTFYGVNCYDFATEAACAGFDGLNREGITRVYTVSSDSQTPGCVWVNSDSGTIVPLDAETGEIGCDLGNPIVELPYDAVTPRMSCIEDGRVTAWESITVNVPAGVVMADVRVSFYDSEGNAVDSYIDLTPDSNGFVDLSGLTSEDTGTQPSIRIDAGDVSDALADEITATVTFVAEDPQLCFALDADNYCETNVGNPTPGSVPDGIVAGTSITRPNVGTDVGSAQTSELPGLNASETCPSSALEIDLPIAQLASTGIDAGNIAIAGFAVLAAGGAAVVANRRRKA